MDKRMIIVTVRFIKVNSFLAWKKYKYAGNLHRLYGGGKKIWLFRILITVEEPFF
jgi:hypothetical protein